MAVVQTVYGLALLGPEHVGAQQREGTVCPPVS